MKPKILSEAFAEFCETRIHFDSLLSKVDPGQKSRVAGLLGAFLRRPWTIASHFKIQLEASPEEFWQLNFIRLKKHPGIHATLSEMWEHWKDIPREGGVLDFPPELVQFWERDWGVETSGKLCRLLTQDPLTTLRFHRRAYLESGELKPEVETWLNGTTLPKSRAGNWFAKARIFKGYATVQRNELYHQGYFEIQDEGSQFMAAFSLFPRQAGAILGESPVVEKREHATLPADLRAEGLRVIDACAGAGGKSLAISDLMGGRGQVFSYDIYEKKIKSLKVRMERAGESNIKSVLIPKEDSSFLDRYRNTADLVVVDSPCSGHGVLRRNPDIKWNRKPLSLTKGQAERPMKELQREILSGYSTLARPGGRVVYGVCTFHREETAVAVARFLEENPGFELETMGFIGPYDTDGFFMAAMRRKD
ncbi:MAG: class I SAM-dependent methyltransferase [Bdellovibrionales bacterium]|nr:class I SAM-dependent methyltransferase [Bdellovibrionales bacterium]